MAGKLSFEEGASIYKPPLFCGRKPNINHLRVFGCSCFVLNNGKENLGKFYEKADLSIFIGYSLTSHA